MNEDRFSLEEIPAEWLAAGVDVDQLPDRQALQAIPRQQSRVVAEIMSNGELPIIDLGPVGGLFVYWVLDGRGITVGMRLKVLTENVNLGSATINPQSPTIRIVGPDIGGYVATLAAGVDTTRCELFVEATLKCGFPIYDTIGGRVGIVYARPWPLLQPGTIEADGITPEMAAEIRNAPERRYPAPRPGFVQNDPTTSTIARTLLWLVNAQGYITAVRVSAEALQAQDALVDPNDLLLAIGLGGQLGVTFGVSGAAGVYITGGGEVGWFGTGSIDIGMIAGVSVGLSFYVFWTGTKGFGGASVGVNLSAGRGLGPKCPIGPYVTIAFYWSIAPRNHSLPAGFCFSIGLGTSPVPLSGYASFGYTYVQKLTQVWNRPAALPASA